MSATASALVQKVWNYAHVMRDHGIGFLEYTEQITYLLFLRMAHEREQIGSKSEIPSKYSWTSFASKSGDRLEVQYSNTLRELGKQPGLLGIIFAKAQNKITEPALLERLISMIAGKRKIPVRTEIGQLSAKINKAQWPCVLAEKPNPRNCWFNHKRAAKRTWTARVRLRFALPMRRCKRGSCHQNACG